MDAATLTYMIEEVCPTVSVDVKDPFDRDTWSYVATPEATPQQQAAADNVIATAPTGPVGSITAEEFVSRFTNAE